MIPDTWPRPDAHALAISERLTAMIREALEGAGGWLPFDRYMELALYAPGLGYYSAGSVKLGAAGDFVTAPEVSALFGRVLAGELAPVLATFEAPIVLELGAGSGELAGTLLDAWAASGTALGEYWILETSADLAERQRRRLARHGDRVRWLEAMPAEPFEGLMLANEVADALPVSVFRKRGPSARPLGVCWENGGFAWAEGPRDQGLAEAVRDIETALGAPLPDGYRSELCTRSRAWIASLAAPIARGACVLIDYGLSRRDYYHASRSSGTLVCHYRHRAHTDPFLLPGLQDISAWVDFSACAEAARAAGLDVLAYTTQAQFLIHGGAPALIEALPPKARIAETQALKTLVLPGEMGERFKVLLLGRGVTPDWPGRDFRDRL